MIMIRLFMPLSFMLQLQLQIRMKLTVLRLLLKRILLLIQITVLIMRIMRIIPIYFQGGSISGGSTFKDGSVILIPIQFRGSWSLHRMNGDVGGSRLKGAPAAMGHKITRPIFQNWPGGLFWDPGVVRNGFLAKFHAGLTYFHIFSTFFENRFFSNPGFFQPGFWKARILKKPGFWKNPDSKKNDFQKNVEKIWK